jgi:predicted secreted Zn-dependent protease
VNKKDQYLLMCSVFKPAQANAGWKPHQRLKYGLITSSWGGLAFFLGSFF